MNDYYIYRADGLAYGCLVGDKMGWVPIGSQDVAMLGIVAATLKAAELAKELGLRCYVVERSTQPPVAETPLTAVQFSFMVAALEFYADPANWRSGIVEYYVETSAAKQDGGEKARAALAVLKGD